MTRSQIIEQINSVLSRAGRDRIALYLHAETIRDIRNMRQLTTDQVIDLGWEIHHTLIDLIR